MKQMVTAVSWIAFSVVTAAGQRTEDTPDFEVASVKPADIRDRGPLPLLPGLVAEIVGLDGGPGTHDPGRIDYQGVSLKMLLVRAYNVKPDPIVGPGWLGSERYTIEATLPPDTNADLLRLMLHKLLAERFRISLHREMKETPVYRLKVARNGPRLKPPEELPHYDSEDDRREAMRKGAIENMARMRAAVEAGTRSGIRQTIAGLVWHAPRRRGLPKCFRAIWTVRLRT